MFPKPKKQRKIKKRLNRVKKSSIARLKRELDKLVSQIVILRDGGCVVCGKRTNLQCGHLFSRAHLSTRWSLVNCNCQCSGCNFKHEFDTYPYTYWFFERYGKDEWDKLHEEYMTIKKWTRSELEELKSNLEIVLKGYQ
jgi:hypothetical protein